MIFHLPNLTPAPWHTKHFRPVADAGYILCRHSGCRNQIAASNGHVYCPEHKQQRQCQCGTVLRGRVYVCEACKTRKCLWCGESFIRGKPSQKYCSPKCGANAYKVRKVS